jgi:hypothetical protein
METKKDNQEMRIGIIDNSESRDNCRGIGDFNIRNFSQDKFYVRDYVFRGIEGVIPFCLTDYVISVIDIDNKEIHQEILKLSNINKNKIISLQKQDDKYILEFFSDNLKVCPSRIFDYLGHRGEDLGFSTQGYKIQSNGFFKMILPLKIPNSSDESSVLEQLLKDILVIEKII